jgi:Ca-activated chloride channel family protein
VRLATSSGGHYARLVDKDAEDALHSALAALRGGGVSAAPEDTRPLYYWPLAAALLLFLLDGVQRSGLTLLLICAALPMLGLPVQVQAAPWQEQGAYEALRAGRNDEAAAGYRDLGNFNGHIALGVIAYRAADWQRALEAFHDAAREAHTAEERALAAYNEGNALARLDRLADATQAYQRALEWRPNFPHAALNLGLVDKARRLGAGVPSEPSGGPPAVADTAPDAPIPGQTTPPQRLTAVPPFQRAGGSPSSWPAALAQIAARDAQAGLLLRYRVATQDAVRTTAPEDAP